MKARVKANGDIFEISDTTTIYPEHYDKSYNITEVEFLDVKENAFPKDDNPDYWTRLEHQYAGMALSRLVELVNPGYEYVYEEVAILAVNYATALVEKLKKEK